MCSLLFTIIIDSFQDNDWVADSTAIVTCDGNAACCSNIIVSSTGGVR